MQKDDRVLVLERINPDKKDTGLFDPRVLSGGNRLRAVMDPGTALWTLKYDRGIIPSAIRYKFTSFKALLQETTAYLANKNIRIVEVLD